ncbi:MAG: peptidoglycan DD-metalloendopeptidase family protein [Clostridia bacterium]|nr:peptidoglycan DD-metalloendopeptidase family protein [Clostridia bacterium]
MLQFCNLYFCKDFFEIILKRSIFLSTKFINNGGFEKIDSIKRTGRLKKFNKKLLRFVKRLSTEISQDAAHIAKKIGDITWETLTLKKFFKGIRKICLPTSTFKQLTTPRGIFNLAMPAMALGLLIFTICFWTMGDYSLNVTYKDKYVATIESEAILTEATAQVNNALSASKSNDKTITPTMQISSPYSNTSNSGAKDVYTKLVDLNAGIVNDVSGLYIDGVFFGATLECDELNTMLTAHLDNAKIGYDGTTTTSFDNNVQIKKDVYSADTLMTAEELFIVAAPYLEVRIESDFIIEYDKAYNTIFEYDDTQPDNYRKVIQKGKDGKQEVYYRLVYVNGVQTDAIVKNSTTTEAPVDEIIVVGTLESGTGTGDFCWPVPSANNISSLFEYRWGSFHHGIDIADIGIYYADIVASDTGIVTFSGWDDAGYGYMVMIDHGNGYKTMYAHCEDLYVEVGEVVEQGQPIAAVGSTGMSTGDHLHFEIWENDVAVNPCEYMNYDGYTTIDY